MGTKQGRPKPSFAASSCLPDPERKIAAVAVLACRGIGPKWQGSCAKTVLFGVEPPTEEAVT